MSKLDDATNKSRARDKARNGGNGQELATVNPDEETGLVGIDAAAEFALSPEVISAKLRSGEWTAQPQLFNFTKGIPFYARLDERGVDAEVPDPRTKEKKLVGTWVLSSLTGSGLRVQILTTVQLDRKLPPYIGKPVCITMIEQRDTSTGGRFNDFLVAGEPSGNQP